LLMEYVCFLICFSLFCPHLRTENNSKTGINNQILVKRVKNGFQITIDSFFKACCSSPGSSCMPQMAHKKEKS